MMFDGIIFDLDGTLWDSSKEVAESWNISLSRMSPQPPIFSRSDVSGTMGLTMSQIAEKLFSPHFGDKAEEICSTCLKEEVEYIAIHGGRVYPGLEETLAKLAPIPLFIVSNCQAGYIEAFLSYTGLGHYFRDFECIGRTGLPKSGNIRLVIERNSLKNPLYVGDTASDEKSAAEADCPFIHAAYGFGKTVSPFAAINSFPELLEKLG